MHFYIIIKYNLSQITTCLLTYYIFRNIYPLHRPIPFIL